LRDQLQAGKLRPVMQQLRKQPMLMAFAVLAAKAPPLGIVHAATANSGAADELDGSKVPLRVLIDNDKVRVNLLTFPAGYLRSEHFPRRSDQILVYLDDGVLDYPTSATADRADSTARAGQPVACGSLREDCGPIDVDGKRPADGLHPRGSVSWRPKSADAAPIRVKQGFRALYIELKHGHASAPDPLAASMPYATAPSGGAPDRVLMDNALFRATLISFSQSFIRAGGFKRRYDTVIAYIDDGVLEDVGAPQTQYAVVKAQDHADGPAVCDRIRDCDSVGPDGRWANGTVTLRGTVAWHPKDGYVENMRIGRNYRAVYIELKD
jgi:hypothetical protein